MHDNRHRPYPLEPLRGVCPVLQDRLVWELFFMYIVAPC